MVALAAIATVIILTYMTLQLLGPQPRRILLSVEERARYTKNIIGRSGAFLYMANVVGALSSLATVYVFFIGATQLFGYFIYGCIISMMLTGFVTTRLTNALLANDHFRARLETDSPTAAAVTSLFWSRDNTSVSRLIKVLTQVSLLAILWLEFTTLTKLFAGLFGLSSLAYQATVMFVAVLFMFDFIIRNGLRGFLFADLLEFPLILLGTIVVLVGTLILAQGRPSLTLHLLVSSPKRAHARASGPSKGCVQNRNTGVRSSSV
jgi:hypothetical protein